MSLKRLNFPTTRCQRLRALLFSMSFNRTQEPPTTPQRLGRQVVNKDTL